jgi:hypothetical protein
MALQIEFLRKKVTGEIDSSSPTIERLLNTSDITSRRSFARLVLRSIQHLDEQHLPSLQVHLEFLKMVYNSFRGLDASSYQTLLFDVQGLMAAPLSGSIGKSI